MRAAPAAHWAERLASVGLPFGYVRTIGEVLDHPQLAARGLFAEVDSPVGTLPLVRFPLGDAPGPLPGHGEHTDQVLAEVGYSESEISGLRAKGIV